MNVFDFFSNDDQNKISECYEAGEFLYRNGTPAIGVFFIRSGRVQVIYQTDEGFLTKEIKSVGEIIALDEMQLLYYISDAMALDFTEVYFFDRFFLREVFGSKR